MIGYCGFWNSGDIGCVVCARERSSVRVSFLPSHAIASSTFGLSDAQREVAPWKVHIFIHIYIYIIYKNLSWHQPYIYTHTTCVFMYVCIVCPLKISILFCKGKFYIEGSKLDFFALSLSRLLICFDFSFPSVKLYRNWV